MAFCKIKAITLGVALVLAQSSNAEMAANSDNSPQSDSGSSNATASGAAAPNAAVEQDALDALKEMSSFLSKAKTMEIRSEGTLDAVTQNGQRIQFDGATTYKIARPGFVIDYQSDVKNRRFIYDGKTFTVYAPKLGFYASAPAPGTNREVLDAAYKKFGIKLPLEDLFRWSDPVTADRLKRFESAYEVGTSTIDGVATDHYAFREAGIDWEIWIQQGAEPFPRKLVIVDRDDPVRPTFTARLTWKLNPPLGPSDFAFHPGGDDKKITLATYEGGE